MTATEELNKRRGYDTAPAWLPLVVIGGFQSAVYYWQIILLPAPLKKHEWIVGCHLSD